MQRLLGCSSRLCGGHVPNAPDHGSYVRRLVKEVSRINPESRCRFLVGLTRMVRQHQTTGRRRELRDNAENVVTGTALQSEVHDHDVGTGCQYLLNCRVGISLATDHGGTHVGLEHTIKHSEK
jgi:hypothetical protein